MSNITIDVEFLAGTTIEQAVSEAKAKAEKWEVAYVCFNFNGAKFSIGRNADVYSAIQDYKNGHHKYGIVYS